MNCPKSIKEKNDVYYRDILLSSATSSTVLLPNGNNIVFESTDAAIFFCSGDGSSVGWVINGTAYSTSHEKRGITVVINSPDINGITSTAHVQASAANNNTELICNVADSSFSNIQTSGPSRLLIQGKYYE